MHHFIVFGLPWLSHTFMHGSCGMKEYTTLSLFAHSVQGNTKGHGNKNTFKDVFLSSPINSEKKKNKNYSAFFLHSFGNSRLVLINAFFCAAYILFISKIKSLTNVSWSWVASFITDYVFHRQLS